MSKYFDFLGIDFYIIVFITIKVIGGDFSKKDIDKIIYKLFNFVELRKFLRKKEKEKNYYKRLDKYNDPWEFPDRKTNDEIEEYYRILYETGNEVKS